LDRAVVRIVPLVLSVLSGPQFAHNAKRAPTRLVSAMDTIVQLVLLDLTPLQEVLNARVAPQVHFQVTEQVHVPNVHWVRIRFTTQLTRVSYVQVILIRKKVLRCAITVRPIVSLL
jgi:hypothetical protein